MSRILLLILTIWVGTVVGQGRRALAAIAVMVEPGLEAYEGTPSLVPAGIVATLKQHGLAAEPLSVVQIVEQGRLTPDRFPVLILPYGNAFPLPALDALRDYHRAGGAMVLTGVPFCHPAVREGGRWKSLGHQEHFDHATGTGSGGFEGPFTGTLRIATPGFRPNPLGLDDSETPLPRVSGRWQCLNAASFPPDDQVTPLIELLEDKTAKPRIASALIRHQCEPFNGAMTVWIGQVASERGDRDEYFATQMLVRGAAYCLRETDRLSAEATEAAFRSVGSIARPAPPPAKLAYEPTPRPWGDSFLPRSKPPAKRLLSVDIRTLSQAEKHAIFSLQGLTSREEPVIWLQDRDDTAWRDDLVKRGHVEAIDPVANWKSLFKRFAGAYRGAVLYDEKFYRGDTLAMNVAAAEDLIICTPDLAVELGIPIKADLRGKFDDYADGLEWTWSTYGERLSRHICLIAGTLTVTAPYAIQWRAVTFWPAGPVEHDRAGVDAARERRVVEKILSEMQPNTAMLGFPFRGEGVGVGEAGGVAMSSRAGVSLVCTDFLPNMPVLSGIPIERLQPKPQPPAPRLERDRIYVAMVLSDGDNQQTWVDLWRKYLAHPRFGEQPLALGIGPPIIDLQPTVAQWYFEQVPANTEFIADVSGIGYMHPDKYGANYQDPRLVFDGFLEWTARYNQKLGLRTVRPLGGGDELLSIYIKGLPDLHSLMPDMGNYSGRKGIGNLTYSLDGMPIFRAVTNWEEGEAGFWQQVRRHVGQRRPAFVNGFVHCWTFDMDDIVRLWDTRDADVVLVTPAQLAELYEESRRRRWTR